MKKLIYLALSFSDLQLQQTPALGAENSDSERQFYTLLKYVYLLDGQE